MHNLLHRPWKHWMAAPMAVSNCKTLVDALSLGSTVLAFLNRIDVKIRKEPHWSH